jgi:hypothetical protein
MMKDDHRGDLAEARPANVPTTETPKEAPHEGPAAATEIGGPQGPEPTRFGDWERKGRCIDF